MTAESLHAIEQKGAKLDTISVGLSYRIIELFSGGLYRSPNKAVEELVANSYDAYAHRVHVILSQDLPAQDAFIAVIDDGESMDLTGLHDLWLIASSRKREEEKEQPQEEDRARSRRRRLPIGKFGIGKLATYVLANKLTHICKKDGHYLAVVMDYGRIPEDAIATETDLSLDVMELSETDTQEMLRFLDIRDNEGCEVITLFGKEAPPAWAVAILSKLKPMARELKAGRLKWVLSTAMPLTPDFVTYLNGELIEPSKAQHPPVVERVIGKDDKVAEERMGLECFYDEDAPEDRRHGVKLPNLGAIWGRVEVYEDTLTTGKSDRLQRSYGFFVMVRERLLNIDDPLFGLKPLSHKTFNRFRMVVHCDGLDDYLRSTRESIVQVDAVEPLLDYLRKKFNEAADAYEKWLGEKEREIRLTTRINAVPRGLARKPLFNLVKNALEGRIDPPRLTRIPTGLTDTEKNDFLAKLRAALESEAGLIEEVDFEDLAFEDGIAVFDALLGRVKVNRSHPFYANYEDSFEDPEPFKLLGVAEILTEAFLADEGVDSATIRYVLERRDRFLRELVYSRRLSARLAAQFLRDAGDHDTGLEKAAHSAFQSLGFYVHPLGGSGKPDGIAYARLGIRDDTGVSASYKIVYDAKSTRSKRVKTANVNTGETARHKEEYQADFAVIIAKDFSDTRGEDSAVIKEARQQKITLIPTRYLADLIEAAAVKRLGYDRLRDLFEICVAPWEVRDWVDEFIGEPVEVGPIPAIIQAIYELQNELAEAVNTTAVFMHLKHQDKLSVLNDSKDVQRWVEVVARLVPEYVTIRDNVVELNTRPDIVLKHCGQHLRELSKTPHREALLRSLDEQHAESK